jgi:histidyl-tRNA synthetase
MSKQQIIQPRILKGTRDFLPKDMVKRLRVMNTFRSIFERFGYDTIETPVIEYAETILGKYGEEGDQLTYTFEDRGGRNIALRYDQTVPTARFVAQYAHDLPIPFKRYQISRVWRADKPQRGRYREFYQCDIDIIGTESLVADAEIAKVIYTCFQELGFKEFTIKINTRRLTNAFLQKCGVSEEMCIPVIRELDKLDKIGVDGVKKQFESIGLTTKMIDQIFEIVSIQGDNREKLQKINMPECAEISEFLDLTEDFKIPETFIEVDFSLARGLDYYTGIIFEVVVSKPDIGSLCGGGRYDDLCSLFTKQKFPGTGIAFGFERIVLVMDELGMFDDITLNAQVLVAIFDKESMGSSIQIYNQLLDAGVNSEIYIQPDKLAKQYKYADKKEIPYVIIQGPDEKAENKVTLKNMLTGEQSCIDISEAIENIRR